MRLPVFWTAVLLSFGALLPASGALADARDLANRKGCGICHADTMRMLGPSWAEIAERYAGKADAAETLFKSTREGSKGSAGDQWGGAPKMGVDAATISDEDLRAVIAWILSDMKPAK